MEELSLSHCLTQSYTDSNAVWFLSKEISDPHHESMRSAACQHYLVGGWGEGCCREKAGPSDHMCYHQKIKNKTKYDAPSSFLYFLLMGCNEILLTQLKSSEFEVYIRSPCAIFLTCKCLPGIAGVSLLSLVLMHPYFMPSAPALYYSCTCLMKLGRDRNRDQPVNPT